MFPFFVNKIPVLSEPSCGIKYEYSILNFITPPFAATGFGNMICIRVSVITGVIFNSVIFPWLVAIIFTALNL